MRIPKKIIKKLDSRFRGNDKTEQGFLLEFTPYCDTALEMIIEKEAI